MIGMVVSSRNRSEKGVNSFGEKTRWMFLARQRRIDADPENEESVY